MAVSDEEVAVIEAALAVDQLFWPPQGLAVFELGEVHQIIKNLHDAVLRLEQKRQTTVTDG